MVVAILTINTAFMHKNTKLLPYQRKDIYHRWGMGSTIASLAREYKVTRKTIYETIADAKIGIFINRSSMNYRYRSVYYGLKRLQKTEAILERKLADRARRKVRYEKHIPGQMVHLDTKRLPLIRGEAQVEPREYLFVAIDDHSRWLFADIFPDKTSYSAAIFVQEMLLTTPFTVTGIYSDNGSEYKGGKTHPLTELCIRHNIKQGYTKVKHPWTNGKAERVIQTLMKEWHYKSSNFNSRDERRKYLYAYVDWYNQVRIHQSLQQSPLDRLKNYLTRLETETAAETESVYNA